MSGSDEFDDDFEDEFEDTFDDEFEAVDDGGPSLPSLRELGESIAHGALDGVGRASARLQERRPLAADVLEADDAFLVVFDAPGANREDLQVQFDGDTVAVRVDRFRDFQEGFETRVPGRGLSLGGEVTLSDPAVDAASAEATLTDSGTIRIHVPKRTVTHGNEGVDESDGKGAGGETGE